MYGVIELQDNDVRALWSFPFKDQAVRFAVSLAQDNEADESFLDLFDTFSNQGFWDQGDWRITVVESSN